MKTRKQYLNGNCTHSEYYAQFVSDYIKDQVESNMGIEALKKAYKENEHLNTIPLQQWDSLSHYVCEHNRTVLGKLKEAGDSYTKAGGVCILKEAAKQLIS